MTQVERISENFTKFCKMKLESFYQKVLERSKKYNTPISKGNKDRQPSNFENFQQKSDQISQIIKEQLQNKSVVYISQNNSIENINETQENKTKILQKLQNIVIKNEPPQQKLNIIHKKVYNDEQYKIQAEELIRKMNQQKKEKFKKSEQQREKFYMILDNHIDKIHQKAEKNLFEIEQQKSLKFFNKKYQKENFLQLEQERKKQCVTFVQKISKDRPLIHDTSSLQLQQQKPEIDPITNKRYKPRFNEKIYAPHFRNKITKTPYLQNKVYDFQL